MEEGNAQASLGNLFLLMRKRASSTSFASRGSYASLYEKTDPLNALGCMASFLRNPRRLL